MDGYRYMVERNKLLIKLEEEQAKLAHLPEAEREAAMRQLEQEFDRKLADLYGQVAAEYPGERRRKKARPLADPR
jgi:hypothetical protein